MKTSGPARDGGFLLTALLLISATFALALFVVWQQRRAAQAGRLQQTLEARLDRELAREIRRLGAAAPPAARPAGQALRAQALRNLRARGRSELRALEDRRQRLEGQLKRLPAARRKEARRELRRLAAEAARARLWMEVLAAHAPRPSLLRPPPGNIPAEPPETIGDAA